MENKPVSKKYLSNIKTSNGRTLRIEIVGEVTPSERHFLDGVAHFTAGTLCNKDKNHVDYVADQLIKMVNGILKKIKGQ
jgi:hypothetical protein